jgi:hypothetical protein
MRLADHRQGESKESITWLELGWFFAAAYERHGVVLRHRVKRAGRGKTAVTARDNFRRGWTSSLARRKKTPVPSAFERVKGAELFRAPLGVKFCDGRADREVPSERVDVFEFFRNDVAIHGL